MVNRFHKHANVDDRQNIYRGSKSLEITTENFKSLSLLMLKFYANPLVVKLLHFRQNKT